MTVTDGASLAFVTKCAQTPYLLSLARPLPTWKRTPVRTTPSRRHREQPYRRRASSWARKAAAQTPLRHLQPQRTAAARETRRQCTPLVLRMVRCRGTYSTPTQRQTVAPGLLPVKPLLGTGGHAQHRRRPQLARPSQPGLRSESGGHPLSTMTQPRLITLWSGNHHCRGRGRSRPVPTEW